MVENPSFAAIISNFLPEAGTLSPNTLIAFGFVVLATMVAAWLRERHVAASRSQLISLVHLSEEVMAPTLPSTTAAKLSVGLAAIFGPLQVVIYIYNRGTKILEPFGVEKPAPIPIDTLPTGLATGVAACFRNGEALAIRDVNRSSIFPHGVGTGLEKASLPKSVLFLPMFAQSETIGVLQVADAERWRRFSADTQALLQHVANQVGAEIYNGRQKALLERLFQTEKLSAAGQLLTGISGELRSPLGSILALCGVIRGKRGRTPDPELDLIEAEALRASEILSRLVAFGGSGQSEAQPVEIQTLLSRVLRMRPLQGAEIEHNFVHARVTVLGSQPQLEQVFLSAIGYAVQMSLGKSPVAISSSLLARRVLIGIVFKCAPESLGDPFEHSGPAASGKGLGLARGIIQSHGGEMRFARINGSACRFEIELPVTETPELRLPPPAGEAPAPIARRHLTAIVVEPEAKVQKQIVELLSRRGDRVVPVASAEEAEDLVHRMRFDLAFAAVRLPGMNWVEFFERVRRLTGAFVLLTPGQDVNAAKLLNAGEGFVLTKPVDERMLNKICDMVADRGAA